MSSFDKVADLAVRLYAEGPTDRRRLECEFSDDQVQLALDLNVAKIEIEDDLTIIHISSFEEFTAWDRAKWS